ncbi:anti-sigma factor RsbA family regulatory protein [Streptomyces sp. NPDC019937]|uniref:anti-sigma factor RsbA family regulatory protein n=1 Tax=Streptomyces sp. NPDC019937 TaxID=3154787 RepID=UPI0033E28326
MSTEAAAGPFVHPALFYRDDEDYLTGTLPFVLDGLRAAEPVAVAVPGANLRLLRGALGRDGAEVRFLDMTEAGRNPGRIIPAVLRDFADRHPGGRVRIIGEPIWAGRTAAEYGPCVQHEALINLAFRGRAVTILCPYHSRRLDAGVLADAWLTHPVVLEDGREHPSHVYDPERATAAHNDPLPPPVGVPAFSFDAERLPLAREFAVAAGERLGLAGQRLGDLALAVSELTTNSVLHGAGRGTVRVWEWAGQVLCQVEDGGRLSDPLAGRRPAAPGQIGGRGLLLVHRVTDLVRVHTGPDGTTIRFHLGR